MKLCEMSKEERDLQGYIEGKEQRCIVCGAPTPYIEICSESHFCSTECVNAFYDKMFKASWGDVGEKPL